jgi:hypothetical protein
MKVANIVNTFTCPATMLMLVPYNASNSRVNVIQTFRHDGHFLVATGVRVLVL